MLWAHWAARNLVQLDRSGMLLRRHLDSLLSVKMEFQVLKSRAQHIAKAFAMCEVLAFRLAAKSWHLRPILGFVFLFHLRGIVTSKCS